MTKHFCFPEELCTAEVCVGESSAMTHRHLQDANKAVCSCVQGVLLPLKYGAVGSGRDPCDEERKIRQGKMGLC